MDRKKNLLCAAAVLFCLLALGCISRWLLPEVSTPQALLTEEQQEELHRFPKSILEATEADLLCVEGIGEKRAKTILLYLQSHEIKSMEQLGKIKGIGDSAVTKLKKYFYVP
ncbi:MAG: helix-hairpin-helix domain-containing protein [Oscillospiraceae bacterium]|nr:helix-hairpin-helix domain-containing protein [Oscillospiraceae bacterium]